MASDSQPSAGTLQKKEESAWEKLRRRDVETDMIGKNEISSGPRHVSGVMEQSNKGGVILIVRSGIPSSKLQTPNSKLSVSSPLPRSPPPVVVYIHLYCIAHLNRSESFPSIHLRKHAATDRPAVIRPPRPIAHYQAPSSPFIGYHPFSLPRPGRWSLRRHLDEKSSTTSI